MDRATRERLRAQASKGPTPIGNTQTTVTVPEKKVLIRSFVKENGDLGAFVDSASGVFRLLQNLDQQYRAALNAAQASK